MDKITLEKLKIIANFHKAYYSECLNRNPTAITFPIKIKTIDEFMKAVEDYIKIEG